jgi:UDP-glucuronate decarboxylase
MILGLSEDLTMLYNSNEYLEDLEYVCSLPLPWEKFENKRILITGSTGLICSFLIDVLMVRNNKYNSNISIYALGRSNISAQKRFGEYFTNNNFFFIEQDVCNPIKIDSDFDYLIHGASNAHPRSYTVDPVGTMLSNFTGMYNVLEFARKMNNTRVLYISSGEVYGEAKIDDDIFDEDYSGYINSMNFRSCYPNSKRAAETLCVSYTHQYNVDTVVVRPCHVYGPTMTSKDSRVISEFIMSVLSSNNIVMKSEGLQTRSYCYVADAVSAILTVLLIGRKGEAYNISDNESVLSIKTLANLIANIGNQQVIINLPKDTANSGFTPITKTLLSTEKLSKLGWNSKTNIESGIKKTIRILKDTCRK